MSETPRTPEEEPVEPADIAPETAGTGPDDVEATPAEELESPAATSEEEPEAAAPAVDVDDEPEDEDVEAADAVVAEEAAPRRRGRRGATEAPPAPAPKATATPRVGGRVVVRAQAKYVRSSARKSRLVADQVRGKSVQEARAILSLTPRAVARDWSKLLESAVANAEHNHELLGDDLRIHAITADEGPTLKRFRPRAMGRATRIRKRTSHLTIQLTPKETR
jgi:ribosomal protein L22